MYTMLWTWGNEDKWDRFDTMEEVKEKYKELVEDPNVCEDDILVFKPEAEDYSIEGEDILSLGEEEN